METATRKLALITILLLGLAGVASWSLLSRDMVEVRRAWTVVPSSEFVNSRRSIGFLEEAIVRNPDDMNNYVDLAQLYMQMARTTSDEVRYLPRARKLLAEALRREPSHYRSRVLKSTLLNTLHRFEEARDMARSLIDENPGHTFNYGTLMDALVELGRYKEAISECDQMLALRPDVASYVRASYLREIIGDVDGAIDAMRLAADAGAIGTESRSWALFQLGQIYLGEAKLDTAEFIFDGILQETPGYEQARLGLGQIAFVRRDFAGAAILFGEADSKDATLDRLEHLAELERTRGDEDSYRRTLQAMRSKFDELEEMGAIIDMEYADFLAEHELDLDLALRLAGQELRRRPKHLHARETYAWALHKRGSSSRALQIIRSVLRVNPSDALLNYRTGMILLAVGDSTTARNKLSRALEERVEIESPYAARRARAVLEELQGSAEL